MTAALLLLASCARLDPATGPAAGPSPSPSLTPRDAACDPFVPPTDPSGERTLLHVTFPDGSEGDLSYPSELDIAALGIQPDATLLWDGAYIAPIVFSFGEPYSEILDGGEPVTRLTNPDGWEVGVWRARPPPGPSTIRGVERWLVVSLPGWTVHTPVPPSVAPESIMEAVRPWESDEGFIALRISAPADLPVGWGEAGGPGLQFGDSEPLEHAVSSRAGHLISLAPEDCAMERVHSVGSQFGATCLADGAVYLSIQIFEPSEADADTIEAVVETIEMENFRPAG